MNDKETGNSYLVVQLFSLEESCVRAWKQKITKLTGLSNVHVALHWDKTQGIIFGSNLSTQGSGYTLESHVQKYNSYRFKL